MRIVEAGEVELLVGTSAHDPLLRATVLTTEETRAVAGTAASGLRSKCPPRCPIGVRRLSHHGTRVAHCSTLVNGGDDEM
jgi:hypothetical protein